MSPSLLIKKFSNSTNIFPSVCFFIFVVAVVVNCVLVFQNFTVVCRFSLLNVPSDMPFLNKCLPICSEYINYLLSFIPFIMDVRERISFKPYLNAVFQYFRIERKPHLNYCQMSKRFKYKNVNPIKAD